ncbi:MAG: GNAT family N-acetyltransferase [Bacteroidota bacterium]
MVIENKANRLSQDGVIIRKATRREVLEIVRLLANDELGAQREKFEDPLPTQYYEAFDTIINDVNQELMVAVDDHQRVIGTFQLSFIQYLTYQGGVRAQIEAVRIREDQRGKGIGEQMFQWAIQRAKERGAHILQLTTDKKRPEALRFYEKLGFMASHEGMKMHLLQVK